VVNKITISIIFVLSKVLFVFAKMFKVAIEDKTIWKLIYLAVQVKQLDELKI
jgi:hypothetical protein